MVSDILEQRIYELVRSHDGIYLFKKKELTPSTDLDSDLRLEDDEALALMDDFFTTFNVDKGNFSITTYYPPEPPLKHLLNPFRKNDIPQAPEFTIGMLIASARAGRWLYELIHAWGLLSVLHHHGAHNVYYVKCTRTFKRHVKAAGFVHAKKLLAHKFDPFPAVTLREFSVSVQDEIVAQRISERPRHFRRKTLFIKACFTRCR